MVSTMLFLADKFSTKLNLNPMDRFMSIIFDVSLMACLYCFIH